MAFLGLSLGGGREGTLSPAYNTHTHTKQFHLLVIKNLAAQYNINFV